MNNGTTVREQPGRTVPRVLAVVAHPDDESFGLGAVLGRLTTGGGRAALLCFTHGEASTLYDNDEDLATVRSGELGAASAVLGLSRVELLHYPDGGLADVPLDELVAHVLCLVADERPSHLLVFDQGGITGHPDHIRATEAALAAGRAAGLPVLAWTLPGSVAALLNAEFGTCFVGRDAAEIDLTVPLSRHHQRRAIACHHSQATGNAVLQRRLDLLGDTEHIRILSTADPRHPLDEICEEVRGWLVPR